MRCGPATSWRHAPRLHLPDVVEQILGALLVVISSFVIFGLMSASVVAVLWGPERGPTFIRRMSYMYSRPTSAFEWFGLTIAALIAVGTQVTVVAFALDPLYFLSFGAVGQWLFGLELLLAVVWLLYLGWLYDRGGRRQA